MMFSKATLKIDQKELINLIRAAVEAQGWKAGAVTLHSEESEYRGSTTYSATVEVEKVVGQFEDLNELDKLTAVAYQIPLAEIRASLMPSTAHDVVENFDRLATDWLAEIAPLSSIRRKMDHPLFREIVAIGEPAIPLILRRVRHTPSHLVWALSRITGENPADKATSKNILDVIEAWIKWGHDRGYES